ncbi:GntR family transcriptional regulator [Sphingomonas sp. AOB5]|uniref:GntR family transcriptional regulator n=1 Tax=Sphingomonas sp. AOB5 TaxID=3034017 RepID=UPI0023F806A9|nr:GntR family transcriptional regulator [Sphingomonas sp. AOB5]MDF7775546.1 GntR family transcriptional regulator [Sphingomonas sp. AOB5]
MNGIGELARGDAVPLYHQIFLALRDEILTGARAEGTILPTEHELAALYDVSRITARRALDELAEHALVERRRRIGTRVTYRGATAPIEANLEQAVEALLAFGRDTQVRVISVEQVPADAEVASVLGIGEGDEVVRAVRLRMLDGEPVGEVVSHIPAVVAQGRIDRAVLEAKPILAVMRDLGCRIAGGRQTISALSADPVLATSLTIEPRAAVLRIERVVTGEGGMPILRTVASYRADRYRLSFDLHSGLAGQASAPISASV